MTAAWLLTLVGGSYALWRYSYLPTKDAEGRMRGIMEREVARLATQIQETREALAGTNQAVVTLDQRLGLIHAIARSDEEQAEIERRYQARRAAGLRAGGLTLG